MARKRVDSAVDTFWALADRVTRFKGEVAESRRASAERRLLEAHDEIARRRVEAANPPPDPALVLAPEVEEAEVQSPGRFGAILSRFKRKAESAPVSRDIECPACGHLNSPPALYCESCRESFVSVGKFMILSIITLAVSCFFSAEYFRNAMEWPWPLYIFFAVVFLVLNSVLLSGARSKSVSAGLWGLIFMIGGGIAGYFGWTNVQDAAFTGIHEFGTLLTDNPILLAAASVFALAAVSLLVGWMTNRYTFPHTYRILLLLSAALCFAGKHLLRWLFTNPEIAKSLSFLDEGTTQEMLDLLSVNIMRVLVAEVLVFAFVKSTNAAGKAYARHRIQPRPAAHGARRSPIDALIDATYPLTIYIVNVFIRLAFQITEMFISLFALVREFGVMLGRFVWVVLREIILPALSLALAAYCIIGLSKGIDAYVTGHSLRQLGELVLAGAGIFAGQLVFLATRSRVSLPRLLSSSAYLGLWLAPYILTLFVFVSISLFTLGKVIVRWDEKFEYHYRIGPLTLAALGLMALAVVFALVVRHRNAPEEAPAKEEA